jgi:membrane protease YdiL (CAAX protease family)
MKKEKLGWLRVLLFITSYVIIAGVFQLIAMTVIGISFTQEHKELSEFDYTVLSFSDLLGLLLVLWIFMRFVDKKSFISLGFKIKNRFSEIGFGLLIGAVIMSFAYFILIALDEIQFQRIHFNFISIVNAILLFMLVAFIEEVLIRGYVLRNLMASFNNYIALIVSAILFTAMHANNPNINYLSLIDLFLAGIVLGASYIYTKNLWFPIALHFSWNLFQALVGFNVSGLESYSIIEFTISKNSILNGGDFGFEGSVLAIISEIIIILGICYFYEKKNFNKV